MPPVTVSFRLLGTGAYLPSRRVTAAILDEELGLPPGTALARNGVESRYFAIEDETASAMASAAIGRAIEAAGISSKDLDAILFCGVMSEQPMPSTAVLIHGRLNGVKPEVTCLDINATCAGFLRGLEMAAAMIHAGVWRHAVVAAAEISSKGLRWADTDTATLFGDGAAAAVLGPGTEAGEGILRSRSATYPAGIEFSTMRAGGSRYNLRTPPPSEDDYLFQMNGKGLLRLAQTHLPPFLEEILDAHAVDVVIPHQASAVGLALLRRHLALRGGRAPDVVDILAEAGNQVSVSVPHALDRAIRDGRLERGQTALLLATAAGMTLSGIVLRY